MSNDQRIPHLRRLVGDDLLEIVSSAKHVCIYSLRFDSSGREIWEKEKIEGTFFMVKRLTEPCFGLCVLNRLTKQDFFLPLKFGSFEFEYEFKDRFLILRDSDVIKAVWFSDDGSDCLEQIKANMERSETLVLATPPTPKYVSKPVSEEGDGENLTRDEMRDALLKLLVNDKVMDRLHAQYVQATESKGKPVAAVHTPMQNEMRHGHNERDMGNYMAAAYNQGPAMPRGGYATPPYNNHSWPLPPPSPYQLPVYPPPAPPPHHLASQNPGPRGQPHYQQRE